MIFGKRFFYSCLCSCIAITSFHTLSAQNSKEVVPIVLPEEKSYDWVLQELPFWGAKLRFPEKPDSKASEIYTEKGLVTQRLLYWSDYRENLLLEAIYYPLPEIIQTKNEKKLIDQVVNRLSIIHGGYPSLSAGTINSHNIREYSLEIRTLKGGMFKAKIFAEGTQVLIVSALLAKNEADIISQSKYFLENVSFQPLPGEVKVQSSSKSPSSPTLTVWDQVKVENFSISFPKKPIEQHKLLKNGDHSQRYYEWYMGDGENQITYLLSVVPLSDLNEKETASILDNAIHTSLQSTNGNVVQRRSLDYFMYPLEELIFKTEQQYFRVRYFCDGKYLYQLLVSGDQQSIYLADANRFLDGLKWIE